MKRSDPREQLKNQVFTRLTDKELLAARIAAASEERTLSAWFRRVVRKELKIK
jgi:hypothetical protein